MCEDLYQSIIVSFFIIELTSEVAENVWVSDRLQVSEYALSIQQAHPDLFES